MSTSRIRPAAAEAPRLHDLANRIGQEVHRIALELRPTALDDWGLQTAPDELRRRTGPHAPGSRSSPALVGIDRQRLPPPVETALYRTAQEALTNVLKHAQAGRVSLIVERRGDHVLAIVEDNGRGFDVGGGDGRAGCRGRLGLLGMQERVGLVGGSWKSNRAPAAGRPCSSAFLCAESGRRPIMAELRIFIADDHGVVREGLKALVNAQPEMRVVGEAGDGHDRLPDIVELRPDVAVMDLSMPGLSGAQATEQLKRSCPEVKVVALTVHEDESYLRGLLEAGAAGYILKRSAARGADPRHPQGGRGRRLPRPQPGRQAGQRLHRLPLDRGAD